MAGEATGRRAGERVSREQPRCCPARAVQLCRCRGGVPPRAHPGARPADRASQSGHRPLVRGQRRSRRQRHAGRGGSPEQPARALRRRPGRARQGRQRRSHRRVQTRAGDRRVRCRHAREPRTDPESAARIPGSGDALSRGAGGGAVQRDGGIRSRDRADTVGIGGGGTRRDAAVRDAARRAVRGHVRADVPVARQVRRSDCFDRRGAGRRRSESASSVFRRRDGQRTSAVRADGDRAAAGGGPG